jgi:hypothetical protein
VEENIPLLVGDHLTKIHSWHSKTATDREFFVGILHSQIMPRIGSKKRNQNEHQGVNTTAATSSTAATSRAEDHPRVEYTLDAGQFIVEQNEEMRQQDEQLVDLEASVINLRDASLTINQELNLQNRLLGEVHTEVDRVQSRQLGTQDRLRTYMRRSGTCKLWLMIIGLIFLSVLILAVLK